MTIIEKNVSNSVARKLPFASFHIFLSQSWVDTNVILGGITNTSSVTTEPRILTVRHSGIQLFVDLFFQY